MTDFNRRAALATMLGGGAAACAPKPALTPFQPLTAAAGGLFRHGVASGDPDDASVVIWTRVTPDAGTGTGKGTDMVRVSWAIAEDAAFARIIASGTDDTGPARDFTVKVLARGLAPGTSYFYRFTAGDTTSPTGRTRTLPSGTVASARFAVVSCSNYPFGYFNVYDQIARRDDLDAVIHLGDYLYEYADDENAYGGRSGRALGRRHVPAHEIISLDDYRARHAQYKADPAARAMHGAHPLIAIWDDHESSNDSWTDGAENHDPQTEGPWDERKRAAMQAYYEWMPVRDPVAGRSREELFRQYDFGDLLTLTKLESRLMARDKPFEYDEIVPTLKTPDDIADFRTRILAEPSRELLGAAQIAAIEAGFNASKARGQQWNLIANQVIMAKVTAPDLNPHVTEEDLVELERQWDQARAFVAFSALELPMNLDAWDGYPAARTRFYDSVRRSGAEGLIVLTGDSHTWWANDLVADDGAPMGVELGVQSVTSPSPFDPSFLGGKGREYALLTNQKNPDVRYLSGEHHGYIDLTVTPEGARAVYRAVDRVDQREYNAFEKVAFNIRKRDGVARFAGKDGLTFKEGWLFSR